MTVLGLIRHGVTDWNQAGRMQGTTDIPLNAEGERQAQLLAQRLKDDEFRWDVLYSSDLKRASKTAEYIREALALETIHIHPLLRERKFGSVEGLTLEERRELFAARPELKTQGETDQEVTTRGARFLEEVMQLHEGKHILIVSHGGFLKRFFKLLTLELPNSFITNTSLTVLKKEHDVWKVDLLNCAKHIEQN